VNSPETEKNKLQDFFSVPNGQLLMLGLLHHGKHGNLEVTLRRYLKHSGHSQRYSQPGKKKTARFSY